MLPPVFHSFSVFLGALLLVTLWDVSTSAESANHIVSAIRPSDSKVGHNSLIFKPVLRSVDEVIEVVEYQRRALINVLTSEQDHSPFRYLLDQSRVVLTNTNRMKCSVGERAVRYAEDRRKEMTSSPSFPHFVAGITAGQFAASSCGWEGEQVTIAPHHSSNSLNRFPHGSYIQ